MESDNVEFDQDIGYGNLFYCMRIESFNNKLFHPRMRYLLSGAWNMYIVFVYVKNLVKRSPLIIYCGIFRERSE